MAEINVVRLRSLLDAVARDHWTAVVEDRDQGAGDSFILVESPADDRKPDLYVYEESRVVKAEVLDLIAEVHNALPALLDEIEAA